MTHRALGHRLPHFLASPLFGDRQRFGLAIQYADPDWVEWQGKALRFYHDTQKKSIGNVVNNAGYQILKHIPLAGKRILELGPGEIRHLPFWQGKPQFYQLADIRSEMLEHSFTLLRNQNIPCAGALISADRQGKLPFPDNQFDAILTFYSLEHFYPLETHLDEILRVLKAGGLLVGAIPCEGGLAWGSGRFVTSRRWMQRNTNIHPDKVICWEHPNFADFILNFLESKMKRQRLEFWPFILPIIDINLVARFVFQKVED